MPVPKRKHSRARRDSKHANKGLKVKARTMCAQCQSALPPHQACPTCGYYKGVKVMTTKLDRAIKRGKAYEAKSKRQAAAQPASPEQA